MEIEPTSRLPTPEERMRQQAEAVGTDVVPINVTGGGLDHRLWTTSVYGLIKFTLHCVFVCVHL